MRWKILIRNRLFVLVACLGAGVVAIGGLVIVQAYRDVVEQTRRVATNLTLTVERDVGRDLHLIDLSVQGIIGALALPGIDAIDPRPRHVALFDQSMNQEAFDTFLVIDGQGRVRDISRLAHLRPPRSRTGCTLPATATTPRSTCSSAPRSCCAWTGRARSR